MFRLEVKLKPDEDAGNGAFPVSRVYIKRPVQPAYSLGVLEKIVLSDWNGHPVRQFSTENISVPDLFSRSYFPPRLFIFNIRYFS